VFCSASPPLHKSFKTYGENGLFLSRWRSWICSGERAWEWGWRRKANSWSLFPSYSYPCTYKYLFIWIKILNGRQLQWHMVLYRKYDENPCLGASFFSVGWTSHPEFLFRDSVCPFGYHKYCLLFLWCSTYAQWEVQLRSVCKTKCCGQCRVTSQLKPCCGSPEWEYLRLAWGLLFSHGRLDFVQYCPCLEAEEPLLNQLWLKIWQDLEFRSRVMQVKLQKPSWLFEESEF